ncbi:N-acetylglucosamine kinase [Algibacter sp. PT7-4]|uniref:N-acetylglucosamine kinase n=1 Tax=Algibacter ulvanivorans TaxID=3400999 RepID=UPI003AAB1949
MVLIADSGSTKCDWILCKDKETQPIKVKTKGLNPALLTKKKFYNVIENCTELNLYRNQVTDIHFFGAGCGTKKNQNKVNAILKSFFKNAKTNTNEDTMAAVMATTKDPAVVCILGTGSNCCYYDGKTVHLKSPALGYILMDEGSGNYFGKALLKAYYYKQMPKELRLLFEKDYNLKEKEIIKRLYKSDTPNKYLANFARFLFKNEDHPFIKQVIINGMSTFVNNHIALYSQELKTVPLHFVGSIAYYAQDYIQLALSKKGLKASSFIKSPIENIIKQQSTNY